MLTSVLKIPVPQMWIGASLALGVEIAKDKENPEIMAGLFDWGRSELTTEAEFRGFSRDAKERNLFYWRQYVSALCRFQWELSRILAHRCCCPKWAALVFELQTERLSSQLSRSLFGESKKVEAVALHCLCQSQSGSMQVAMKAADGEPYGTLEIDLAHGPVGDDLSTWFTSTGGRLDLAHRAVCSELSENAVVQCEETTLTSLTLRSAEIPPSALPEGWTMAVRVIAFERKEDAENHVAAFHTGSEEPVPHGLAHLKQTMSCAFVHDGTDDDGTCIRWGDSMEFIGYGECATKAQAGIAKLLPQVEDGEVNATSWRRLLPPRLGAKDVSNRFQEFAKLMVPWLMDDSKLPKGWSWSESKQQILERHRAMELAWDMRL